MKTVEACNYFKISTANLRKITKELDIKTVGVGKIQVYSNIDVARIKAGIKYKDYTWATYRARLETHTATI